MALIVNFPNLIYMYLLKTAERATKNNHARSERTVFEELSSILSSMPKGETNPANFYRLLGFVQGALWCNHAYELPELERHWISAVEAVKEDGKYPRVEPIRTDSEMDEIFRRYRGVKPYMCRYCGALAFWPRDAYCFNCGGRLIF